MNQHELHNYLPFNTQYRNKYEDSCPLFYGELAVADSDFRILTARGPSLCEGSRFALTDANKRFLFKTLTESRRVVLRRRSQIVLVSGELLPAGFYLLLLPEGERNAVAGAMSYLAGMRDMILSAAARKAAEKSVGDEGFSAAEDEMALLDGILRPESGLSFAELCERIAFYAGCHIRFDDSLRRVSLPELRSERIRLTAFLLCIFLILRKVDPDGADLAFDCDGGFSCRVLLRSTLPVSGDLLSALEAVLRHPSFAPFRLEWGVK